MEENIQEKLEEIAMMIIANSGQARSDSFAALQEAKGFLRRRRKVCRLPMNPTENC